MHDGAAIKIQRFKVALPFGDHHIAALHGIKKFFFCPLECHAGGGIAGIDKFIAAQAGVGKFVFGYIVKDKIAPHT